MTTETPPEDWRTLLEQAILDAKKGGRTTVSETLGVSRSYVSRVMSTGKSGLNSVSPRFIDRVIHCYSRQTRVDCPATQQRQARSECAKANQPAPTHNPIAVQIWRQCQVCPNKP